MSFKTKVDDKTGVVAVVGLGYVGLPLVLAFAKAGFRTIGVDIDKNKTEAISQGRSYIKHIDSASIQAVQQTGKLVASTDFSVLAEADAIIMCVPTPLDRHFEPDLSYVVDTIEAILPHVRPGQVISLESTTYPGTTDEELVTRLNAAGFQVGENVYVVYSPEREDPGNPQYAATNIPKVVGGTTAACGVEGVALYGAVFDKCSRKLDSSGGTHKALGKYLPLGKHRSGQRTQNRFRSDGNRYMGGHCSGFHQAVWI